MADNTTDTKEAEKPEVKLNSNTVPSELEVTRGGVTWLFKQAKLKKKSQSDPERFGLVPEKPKNDEEFTKFIQFLNNQQAALLAHTKLRGMAANWTNSSVNDVGDFNQEQFLKMVEDMSARGETLTSLKAEQAELTNAIIALSQNTTMSMTEKVEGMNKIAARLNEIKETIDWKTAQNKPDAELEEATAAT